jgi:hypothetical protein
LQGEIHSVHTVRGDELKALRALNRNWPSFTGERARSNVAKMIEAAGVRAGLPHWHRPNKSLSVWDQELCRGASARSVKC